MRKRSGWMTMMMPTMWGDPCVTDFASKIHPRYDTGSSIAAMYFLASWVKGPFTVISLSGVSNRQRPGRRQREAVALGSRTRC